MLDRGSGVRRRTTSSFYLLLKFPNMISQLLKLRSPNSEKFAIGIECIRNERGLLSCGSYPFFNR
jgi:hypothetical protein